MFPTTFFKFIFIFNAAGISFAIRPTNPSHKDAIDLLNTYPNVMKLHLNPGHEFLTSYPYMIYDATEKKGMDLFFWLINKEECGAAYDIVYNVLESVCYTYMYRFCVFAIEMNTRGGNLTQCLENFIGLMEIMYGIFIEEDYPRDFIQFLMDIYYYNNNTEQIENGYTIFDEDYVNKLSQFLGMVESKINITKIKTYIQQNAPLIVALADLKKAQLNEIRDAIDLLQRVPAETNIENQDDLSCMGCEENLSWDDNIISVDPCGHITDYCFYCSLQFSKCPLCQQERDCIREGKIVKRSRLFGYDFWDRIPRNEYDQEARCVRCKRRKPLKTQKMIAIPCGHGFYCQKCIKREDCLICEEEIKDALILNI